LPSDIAAIITLQLARGLDYAHFRGIIHRDIKPANIMVSMQGDVKLMDFGIARHERFGDLTETGTGLGTPSYMSPEQILGDKLDFRSDIFSVGIVLYQMLTGRKPFVEDESRTVMQKIRLDRYEPTKKLGVEVPRKLERIMSRCLQKMPANRYPTTQALIDDLVSERGRGHDRRPNRRSALRGCPPRAPNRPARQRVLVERREVASGRPRRGSSFGAHHPSGQRAMVRTVGG
jgi:serine/threonine-protein kinase